MISNDVIFKELSEEEGVRFTVYLDTVDVITIGIGHNLVAKPIDDIIGRKFDMLRERLTIDEVKLIFEYDVNVVITELDRNLPWWRSLPDFAQYVLISLCFNLGITRLLKFKNTLRLLKDHRFVEASDELKKSRWYKQVKSRGVKLCKILKNQQMPSD